MLSSSAYLLIMDLMGDDYELQQDNCSFHMAEVTKIFLDESEIPALDSLVPVSPDAIVIENVLGMTSVRSYDDPQSKNFYFRHFY